VVLPLPLSGSEKSSEALMLKVYDAYIMDWLELSAQVEIAVDIGANAPNDAYLRVNKGPFLVVPVMNTTETERLMAVVQIPYTPNLIETPALPEVLTISNMSVIDGSMAGARPETLCVFLEARTSAIKNFTVFPQRLPQEFVKNCRALGMSFIAGQMRHYGEAEAAERLLEAAKEVSTTRYTV
jgi:hypothetical protein